MAGEWILHKLNDRGGSDSDYSSIVFGEVISVVPLKIQISNQMVLTDNFLILGRHLTKHREKISNSKASCSEGGNVDIKEIEIDGRLKVGDGVTLVRLDGGQQFYVLEKTE